MARVGWRFLMLAGLLIGVRPMVLAQAGPAFEVATIKPAAPSPDGHTHIIYPPDGRFSAINITLVALMEWAYGMPSRQILDGPGWLGSTRFDIEAKSDEETDGRIRKGSGEEGREIKRGMVRALLEERYEMKVHTETRVLPAYDLVVAKGGSKLPLTKSDGKTIGTGRTYFHGQGLTVTLIAEQLSQIAGRVVVDKTGLSERYDVKLDWTPDSAMAGEDSPPPLFTAIQEQLGLKLDAAKEPVPVLVVDHIDAPSAN
ncbi:CHP03435 domain-containing protein [Granulicella sibirica]|uniref:CHP03435 domain-containing protein n=2 Tax=Granulicella sibirica TaxID=2479048 RepID=A0A4Q0T356_9BACT|nr:CHP03435 domain-containing protein [Granulicella sibirica]